MRDREKAWRIIIIDPHYVVNLVLEKVERINAVLAPFIPMKPPEIVGKERAGIRPRRGWNVSIGIQAFGHWAPVLGPNVLSERGTL